MKKITIRDRFGDWNTYKGDQYSLFIRGNVAEVVEWIRDGSEVTRRTVGSFVDHASAKEEEIENKPKFQNAFETEQGMIKAPGYDPFTQRDLDKRSDIIGRAPSADMLKRPLSKHDWVEGGRRGSSPMDEEQELETDGGESGIMTAPDSKPEDDDIPPFDPGPKTLDGPYGSSPAKESLEIIREENTKKSEDLLKIEEPFTEQEAEDASQKVADMIGAGILKPASSLEQIQEPEIKKPKTEKKPKKCKSCAGSGSIDGSTCWSCGGKE